MQLTSNIMMVRPAHFGYNAETAENNAFQTNDGSLSIQTIKEKAINEFDTFVSKLRAVGVNVIVIEDTDEPVKTDAVFPNNWISFHDDGIVVTYPMFSTNRRLERRFEIIDELSKTFQVNNHIQFEGWEAVEQFLEGTGSLILDREHRIAYACLSVRTDATLLEEFCEAMFFEKIAFHSFDRDNLAVYHTNVMMALGDKFVVICMDSVPMDVDKQQLLKSFEETHKEVIEISLDQMYAFAGNMLQVKNESGNTFLVMSSQAFQSLTPAQIEQIERHTSILHSDLTIIETYGGGSARCMMAEVFLPKK
jgi:hypothetical protein